MKNIKITPGKLISRVLTTKNGEVLDEQRELNEDILTKIYCLEDALKCHLEIHFGLRTKNAAAFWAGRFIEAADISGMTTEVVDE